MTRTIWKHHLGTGRVTLDLPERARVIHFGPDPRGDLCLWEEHDRHDFGRMQREFGIVGTGWEFDDSGVHVASAVTGAFVWHLYEFPAVSHD